MRELIGEPDRAEKPEDGIEASVVRHADANDVRSLVRFLIMVLLCMGVWIAIGLGVGVLLHWLVPAMDVGMATLIGVVTGPLERDPACGQAVSYEVAR
jgi:hypothetical protein